MIPFLSEFRRWGVPANGSDLPDYGALSKLDEKTRALFEIYLRRGVSIARLERDRQRINYFQSLGELMQNEYQPRQVMLGKLGRTLLGYMDDRPILTLAGSRSGKSSTILEPNVLFYPGSMLVLDPKGELAQLANIRRAMGHRVYVVDGFGQSGHHSASFNPLDELNPKDPAVVDDVMSVARALVPEVEGGGNAKHFNDSARLLLRGVILLTLLFPESERNLITVRELLCLSYKPFVDAGKRKAAQALAKASEDEKTEYFDRNAFTMNLLLNKMASAGIAFGGILASIGARLLGTPVTERGSIFSSAAVATDFIDSLLLRKTLRHSDFRLASLRSGQPTTVFLCLPVGRMDEHFRYLRLIVQLACTTLERLGAYPRDRPPILFMLEEFATLGRMDFMERAAAYFPGFGIQPWFVLQDLGQLKQHYPTTFQSFLGNAGLVQLFATGDLQTIAYAVERCGKLIAPWELEAAFAREQMSQLLLFKGRSPAAAMRLSHEDVARFREHAARGITNIPELLH